MPGSLPSSISRRRAIRILGAAAGMLGSRASLASSARATWRGSALGAPAQLTLCGGDATAGERAIAACLQEIERLEIEFSLYRQDSALSCLNREGVLASPSTDMLALLNFSRWLGDLSHGAFDVSVQPLWQCYAQHFRQHPGDPAGPDSSTLASACELVDYRRIVVLDDRVGLDRGMALTLNGIAQGFITDRIADLLREAGWTDVLVDMGEIRGLGLADGITPWRIETPAGMLLLKHRAVATSAGKGSPFEPTATHHHLLDPRTGRSSQHYESVTVIAPRATLADALSTTLVLLEPDIGRALLTGFPKVEAYARKLSGELLKLSA